MYKKLIIYLTISSLIVHRIECNSSELHQKSNPNVTLSEPCNQTTSLRHILLAIFSVSVLLIGICGNLMSILVIQTSRHLRSQIAYLFVTSLAVADLGVSFFITTVKVDMYWKNGSFCHGFGLCVFMHITDNLFPMLSISHLLIIGIDRWYAIASPFTYVSNMTSSRARYVIGAVWCYAFVWTLLGIFTWDTPSLLAYEIRVEGRERYCFSDNKYYHTIILSIIYILPMSATTGLYVIVLFIAMKQAAAISKFNVSKKKIRRRRLNSEAKAAKTVAAVFFAYIICWVPHIVIVIMNYWTPDVIMSFHQRSTSTYDIVTTIIHNILPPINSCINPFIYFIFGAQFRVAFKDLYCKLLNKPRHSFMYGNDNQLSQNRSLMESNGDNGSSMTLRKSYGVNVMRTSSMVTDTRNNSFDEAGSPSDSVQDCIKSNGNGTYGVSLL